MNKTIKWIFSVTLLSTSLGCLANEPIVVSGHPDYPPFMSQQGNTIVGVGVDIAAIILHELNIPMIVKYTGPWKRVQKNARHGRIDLIVGIYSNKERQGYLDYTAPYALDPTTAFTLKERKFPYKSRDDLVGKRGTTMLGDSFGEEFDQFIKDNLQLDRVFKAEENFQRLLQGRAEYLLWGYYPTLISAKKLGYERMITPVTESIVDEHMHMAFSKQTRFTYLIPLFNKAIAKLKANGTIKKLIAKHMGESNAD